MNSKESLENLAAQKRVLIPGEGTNQYKTEYVTDGQVDTYWQPVEPALIVDLGTPTTFNRVTIYEHSDCKKEETIHILGYDLSVSNDGICFESIDSYEVVNQETKAGAITMDQIHSFYHIDCKMQEARYIKLTITKTKTGTLPQISEIKVSKRPVTKEDQEWSDFINDTSWQNGIDVCAVGKGSLIANYDGGELQLKVTDRPYVEDITSEVIFSIDKPELATVSETGLVTAKAPGKVKVTAKSKETGLSGSVDIEIIAPDAKYKATWGSLISTYKPPKWYTDAKFGLYFHWGAYAVIARENEWFLSRMHKKDEQDERFFLDKFGAYDSLGNRIGYKDCYKYFSGDQFDADEWAALAKDIGAKFLVPASEHHDSFTLYDSSYTRWKATNIGPKQDIIQKLKEAATKKGLKFGFSNHYKENQLFFAPVKNTVFTDTFEPKNFDFYSCPDATWNETKQNTHDQAWYNRTTELVDKYNPDFVLFDWHVIGDDYTKDFLTHYYNHAAITNPEGAVMTIKLKAVDGGYIRGVERGCAAEIRDMPWEGNTSISRKSWGYVEDDEFKSSLELVGSMVDVVSKNGVFLLNVGPDLHGKIPEKAQIILREIGDWLQHNGEAIYKTKPWCSYGEGPTPVKDGYLEKTTPVFTSQDYRFTQSNDYPYLYIIGMKYPEEQKTILIQSFNKDNLSMDGLKRVVLLNGELELKYQIKEEGLMIVLPEVNPDKKVDAYAIRLEFEKTVPQISFIRYSITVQGGTSNYYTAKEGTTIVINAYAAKKGATFKKWEFISGSAIIDNMTSPHARLIMPASDVKVKAVFDQPFSLPRIIEGNGQSILPNRAVTFKSNADYEDFKEVKVDGQIVAAERYWVKGEKLTITLKPDWVAELSKGAHEFRLDTLYGTATAEFTIG